MGGALQNQTGRTGRRSIGCQGAQRELHRPHGNGQRASTRFFTHRVEEDLTGTGQRTADDDPVWIEEVDRGGRRDSDSLSGALHERHGHVIAQARCFCEIARAQPFRITTAELA